MAGWAVDQGTASGTGIDAIAVWAFPTSGAPATLLQFWTMVAHYHAQIWNHAEPARSLGVSQPTIRRYLDLPTISFEVLDSSRPFHWRTALNLAKILRRIRPRCGPPSDS